MNARALLYIPPGGVPWGDAAGWPDVTSTTKSSGGTPKPTHSWALDERGTPVVAVGEAPATMQRHGDIANTKPVWGLLFGLNPKVTPEAQATLAYVLAGVGCRPKRQWAQHRRNNDGQKMGPK